MLSLMVEVKKNPRYPAAVHAIINLFKTLTDLCPSLTDIYNSTRPKKNRGCDAG